MIIFRNGRMEYGGKIYLHYKDLGGLVVVSGEEDKNLYLVFHNSKGDVQELLKLKKGMDSLKRNFFQEVFPIEIETVYHLNFVLCLAQRGLKKYLLVYETALFDEGQGMHSLRFIEEVSDRDMIIFSDPGVCKVIPFGINEIFSITGNKLVPMFLCTEPNLKRIPIPFPRR